MLQFSLNNKVLAITIILLAFLPITEAATSEKINSKMSALSALATVATTTAVGRILATLNKNQQENNIALKSKSREKRTRKKLKNQMRQEQRPNIEKSVDNNSVGNIKIATQNIRGGIEGKINLIREWMQKDEIDICVITETKFPTDKEDMKQSLQEAFGNEGDVLINGLTAKECSTKLKEKKIKKINKIRGINNEEKKRRIAELAPEKPHAQGGILLVIGNRVSKYMKGKGTIEKDHRTISITLAFPKKVIQIHGMYGPSDGGKEREIFWKEWKDKIIAEDEEEENERIIIGDMNAYRWDTDAKHQNSALHTPSKAFCELFEDIQIVDSYSIKHQGKFKPTFTQLKNGEAHYEARLDAALVSQTLIDTIEKCKIKETNLSATSDHKAVILELKAEELGIREARTPKLYSEAVTRIDVKEIQKKEKKKMVQENIQKEFTKEGPLQEAFAQELVDAASIEAADLAIADTIRQQSSLGYGTHEVEFNHSGIQKENKKVAEIRRYLLRVRKVIGGCSRHGTEIKKAKSWKNLNKNPGKYLPASIQNNERVLQMPKLMRELRVLQHTLEKDLNNLDKITTSERIDKYLEQLDENEERNPQRFFRKANLDRRRGKKCLYEICEKDANGKVTRVLWKKEDVKEFIQKYWAKIFTKQKVDDSIMKEWFGSEEWKNLQERMKKRAGDLSAEITKEEIESVVKSFKKGTAPGEDGVPIDCYQHSPPEIFEALAKVYNATLKYKTPPTRWQKGLLFMLHKGGNAAECNNYRPIALLNVQYKIFTKILYMRMLNVMEEENAITNAQGGWRKNRSTWQKINTLIATIRDANEENKEIHLTYVDLKKAYDSTDHDTLIDTLTQYGFDENLTQLIKALNTGNTCSVITVHGRTETYPIERGVRQGCPLSPLLFMIYIEPLMRWMEKLEGVKIKNTNLNIAIEAFADDMALISSTKEAAIEKWEKLKIFCKATGLEISNDGKEKTAYTTNSTENIAKLHDNAGKEIPRLEPDESYKYLGVHINLNLNWTKQTQVIEAKLVRQTNYLRHRAFTSRQTIMIINKVFIPSIMYRANVMEFDNRALRKWDAITSSLVFRKMRMFSISGRKYLWGTPQQGGMALASIEVLAKAAFTSSQLSNNFNATDSETNVAASVRFKPSKERIRIVRNGMKNQASRRDLKNWVSWGWAASAEARGIKSLDSIHINGKLRDQQWWESHFVEREVQKGIREELTGYDNTTLRAEALDELELHAVRPSFEEEDFIRDCKNRIRTWTDGALRLEIRYGTYAIYLGKSTSKFATGRIYGALSSFEAELRAIWNVLRSLPLDQHIVIYTDSESVITRITKRREGDKRKENNERYEAYMQRVLDNIRKRTQIGARTDLEFVYSHLLDTDLPTMSEEERKLKEEKKRKMENKYATETDMILTGNQCADKLAGALKNSNYADYRDTLSVDDHRYMLEINGAIVTKNHRKECYNATIEPIISKNKWDHIESYDWWLKDEIDIKNSCHFTQSKWRNDVKDIEFIFRCRNGRLTTTKNENKKVIKELENNTGNYYIEKRRRLYSSPYCPFGCATEETIEHICKCKNTSNIREEAKRQIRARLYQDELTPNFVDEIWWFSDQGAWQEKFAWMAFTSSNATKVLQEKIGEKKMISLLCDVQRIAAAALKEMWRKRCIKLHTNNPPRQQEKETTGTPIQTRQKKRKEPREISRKQKITKITKATQTKKKKATRSLRNTPTASPASPRADTHQSQTHTPDPEPTFQATTTPSTVTRTAAATKRNGRTNENSITNDPTAPTTRPKKKRLTPHYNFQPIHTNEPSPPQSPSMPDDEDPILQPLWPAQSIRTPTPRLPTHTQTSTTLQTHTSPILLRNFRYTIAQGLQYLTPPSTKRRSSLSPPRTTDLPQATALERDKRSRVNEVVSYAVADEEAPAQQEQQQQLAEVQLRRRALLSPLPVSGRPADDIESVQRREAALTLSLQLDRNPSQTCTDQPLYNTAAVPSTERGAVPAAIRSRRRIRQEEEDNEWTRDNMPSARKRSRIPKADTHGPTRKSRPEPRFMTG